MEKMWTLHVENFGRIESADIELSPLTLFVGDNNSGKSYLLALIYGLMCVNDSNSAPSVLSDLENNTHVVLSDFCENTPEYRACVEWLEQAMEQAKKIGNIKIPFDDYAYTIFENFFNRILKNNQTEILRWIFNEDISAGKISVSFTRGKEDTLDFEDFFGMMPSFAQYSRHDLRDAHFRPKIKVVFYILSSMLLRYFPLWGPDEKVIFLPSVRTGLLLTYPALAQDTQNFDVSLMKPASDFIRDLFAVSTEGNEDYHPPVVQFIERNMIHGQIIVYDYSPPEFFFHPEGAATALPMFLTSGIVKELTPLILALQYQQGVEALFIEEPEMNLHPQSQQMIARTLIKLVNGQMPVIVTTHSDTIVQHINNMVKLHNLPEARRQTLIKRFGFDPDDLISADNVSMYQFDVQDNGKTIVKALKCGDYGFEVPTFYDPLEILLKQTQATEPDAEEYED